MFWMGVGVTLVAGIITIVVMCAKRPAHDLGTLSDRWMARYRVDAL